MGAKLNRRQALIAGGAAIAGSGLAAFHTAADSNEERTIEWDGEKGGENASRKCEGRSGRWHWILTPGGSTPIDKGAELTVTFEDSTEITVEGDQQGQGGGAIHFVVWNAGGGTVERAKVTFTGGGNNALLTLGDSGCVEDPDDPEEPNDPEEPKDPEEPEEPEEREDPEEPEEPAEPEYPEEPQAVYWQVDFGHGEMPPLPPFYYPDDVMSAIGHSEDGVSENPSHLRRETDGQLGDVWIDEWSFDFDDEDEPTEVSVTFEVDGEGDPRDLHLGIFVLPGPFDADELEEQVLFDAISNEYAGGDGDTLTLPLP